MLQPGERVVIAAGIYRECVRPARGGASPAQMISYEAAPGAKVFIKGSEVLKDGWVTGVQSRRRSRRWRPGRRDVSRRSPHGATNSPARCFPMPTSRLPCPASWAVGVARSRAVDMGPFLRRRGLVFVDGKPLEPVEQQRELAAPRSAAGARLHGTCPAAKRPAAAPSGRADHAGGRRLARCALLGGDVGTGDSDSSGFGHAGRPRDRSDHPSSGVRSRAERRWASSASRGSPFSTPPTRIRFRSSA